MFCVLESPSSVWAARFTLGRRSVTAALPTSCMALLATAHLLHCLVWCAATAHLLQATIGRVSYCMVLHRIAWWGMTWYGLVLPSAHLLQATFGMVWYYLVWCGTAHLLQPATIQPNDGTQPIAPSPVFSSSVLSSSVLSSSIFSCSVLYSSVFSSSMFSCSVLSYATHSLNATHIRRWLDYRWRWPVMVGCRGWLLS